MLNRDGLDLGKIETAVIFVVAQFIGQDAQSALSAAVQDDWIAGESLLTASLINQATTIRAVVAQFIGHRNNGGVR